MISLRHFTRAFVLVAVMLLASTASAQTARDRAVAREKAGIGIGSEPEEDDAGMVFFPGQSASRDDAGNLTINFAIPSGKPKDVVFGIQLIAVMTLLTLAPALLIMLTSFTRISIVLGFVRRALSTQEVPPTQILIGLSLFLTFFVMAPTWNRINDDALQPYMAEQITMQEAYTAAVDPIRDFMFFNTRESDLALFVNLSRMEPPEGPEDIPLHVLVPSFLISELQTAFLIGFIIYIPFLVIDMVISSILLSMGMMMLPPVIVSLPFKIILFVLVDGWALVIGSLVRTFGVA